MDEPRYITTQITSAAIARGTAGSPTERTISVYLPPGYHETHDRYPAVYLLHGYGGDGEHLLIGSKADVHRTYPFLARLLFRRILADLTTFETLDRLITGGELPRFILVQPDGSLRLPQNYDGTNLDGTPVYKGSLYFNSPLTGDFETFAFTELVDHIDEHFRTVADRSHRYIVGGSMGGYGALLAGTRHADRFSAVAALSPSVSPLDLLDVDLVFPYLRRLLGSRAAVRRGAQLHADILETCDMVFSPERRLVRSIVKDERGAVDTLDAVARDAWAAASVYALIDSGFHTVAETHQATAPFADVRLRITCEEDDEFGFAEPCRRLSTHLHGHGISHEFEIFSHPVAKRISPHSIGIAKKLLEGVRFVVGV